MQKYWTHHFTDQWWPPTTPCIGATKYHHSYYSGYVGLPISHLL